MNSSYPNVIYILGDDHRAEQLGSRGHPLLQTPNLDKLSRQDVQFTNAFCTSPACTPSRTCHYTGQWERKHGINFNSGSSLSPEAWARSFPMRLKEAGYSWDGLVKTMSLPLAANAAMTAATLKRSSTTGTATTGTVAFTRKSSAVAENLPECSP
jgi:hypothetical protein